MKRAEGSDIFPERIHSGECYSGNSLREEGKIVRKLSERIAAVTWFITVFFQLGELTDKFQIYTEFEDWYLPFLHLVPARETRASSGVLRSHCLSALQELVGRNSLPLLIVVQVQEQVLPSINLLFLFIYLCMIECHVCS